MGQTRTAEQLKEAGFEAVINAVGAHSAAPRIPGFDGVNVADAWKVLAGEQQVYGTVAVIGGGMVGCETAEYLAARGCKVSVIEMMDKIAAGESTTILPTLLENYKTYGVEQYPGHKVKGIPHGCRCLREQGRRRGDHPLRLHRAGYGRTLQ